MNLLVDENFDRSIADWLRDEGHDVDYAAHSSPSASDDTLFERASTELRYIVTYDRHFGEKAAFDPLDVPGVLLIRFRFATTWAQLRHFQSVWPTAQEMLPGNLVVATHDRLRPSHLGRRADE